MEDKHQKFSLTWFFRLFLNSQAVTFLLVTLLTFVTIFIFSKISFLFRPIGSFLEIVLLPMILTGLLYYLLNPMVDWMEKHKISRTVGISILFVLISLLIIWGLAVAIPSIQEQVTSFAQNLPSNIQKIEGQVTGLLQDQRFEQFRPTALEMLNKVNDQIVAYAQKFSSSAVNWASNLISTASQIIVAILIMPFILFYLLRDGQYLNKHITQYLPTKWREPIGTVLSDVNGQLSNYVRGQVTVAIIVALMFSVMFSIIGLSYPITLGVMAGFLNLIPYLGSFLAMIPAVILGLIAGPIMLIKVLVVFMIEQTIEGRFVTPLIIGSSLSIHPITILFVLLTAGQMYGVLGVLLGIPIYASIKVLVKAAFEWYKAHSGLYEDEENEVVNEQ
ncbi:TPA: AI-2E family transporter [Streptococcus suis]|uniref:Membrane protein n=1 Tax=Streptococcus suis 6407 TaxID=1214179 RepID=A0A075SF08_STRSU|nr:AI-2E family transporter [Streptococcus suis]AIG43942.1 membrane protein [Streptococcus suis 6407]MCK3953250.1 AI-2E family transporter [Streptococcus suis]MCK4056691.1 AI-2E family transporter [Streptococcus suis]MDD7565136.1 AI-2E family transporter [Streptococcus suis]MDW8586144.1 AI-2E family transporter [Streptococcus suis]